MRERLIDLGWIAAIVTLFGTACYTLAILATFHDQAEDQRDALYLEARIAVEAGHVTQGLRDVVFALTPADE